MKLICGLDEAGRGALAGPLVAAAVILSCPPQTIAKMAKTKIKDGKLLTAEKREKIYKTLIRCKAIIAIEVISARKINNHGIGWANKEIFRKLIKQIEADKYIADGNLKLGRIAGKNGKVFSVVDADAVIPEVILAGIAAKVERDRLMQQLHEQFPLYKWRANKGYGTKKHLKILARHGSTRYHRSIYVTTAMRSLAIKESNEQESLPRRPRP